MTRVSAGEITLNYEEFGRGPDPLVLVHGWTGTLHNWDAMLEYLPLDEVRVFAFDARGAGSSDRPHDGYQTSQLADDIAVATAKLGIDVFHFAGHSMGGFIGLQMALRHPQRLNRLMLVAPPPAAGVGVMGEGGEQFFEAMSQVFDKPESELEFIQQALSARQISQDFIRHLLSVQQPCSQEHFEQCWEGLKEDISARLSEIGTETLMIAGDRDFVFRFNLADYALIPGAALQVFYRVGHMLPWEVPMELSQTMADFMRHGVAKADAGSC